MESSGIKNTKSFILEPARRTNEKNTTSIYMDTLVIIFTDLDGTLLDHNSYSFAPATSCLDTIRRQDIPLIFTSSKTAVEIEELCAQTNLYHPYIAENGGLLAIPENYFSTGTTSRVYEKELIGTPRRDIAMALKKVSGLYKFKSFSEMACSEIMQLAGLDEKQACNANARECSEPVHWRDGNDRLEAFAKHLEDHDLQLLSGGRFYHVMGHHDKAMTMSLLLKKYQGYRSKSTISIALGDSPNDLKMLESADYGVVIPNPDSPNQGLDSRARLICADNSGPRGWNDTLTELLEELHQ